MTSSDVTPGSPLQPPRKFTGVTWLICGIAAIGFAFDIYELLMLPLIVGPALAELTGATPGTPEFQMWVGRLFYVPALVGGLFGLLGGYLTDRLGRRRVLTWSILLYAFSAFAASFSTSVEMLLILRCTTFIGVCVEFVAAIAWLAELFPEPKQRERVLGYTQAFSSIGGLLVAVANGLAVAYAPDLPAIALPDWLPNSSGSVGDPHAAWRYTLMSGLIPAVPLIVIRPFLPESPVWREKKSAGTLRRPSLAQLFSPAFFRTTVITTILFACSYGAAFGALQHVQRIVPGLAEVQQEVQQRTEAADESIPPAQIRKQVEQEVAANVTKTQEVGGLVGRLLLAFLAVRIASRRQLLRWFLLPGLFLMPLVFGYAALVDLKLLYVGVFLAGAVIVAQFSFWGNYLPLMYPVHLRATGESFAANIGGRMIGTLFAWVTSTLAARGFMPNVAPTDKLAYAAAMIGTFVFALAIVISIWLPEPPGEST